MIHANQKISNGVNRQYIIIGGIAALVILIGLALTFGLGQKPATFDPVNLEMWGFGDNVEVWEAMAVKFREQNPYISVTYRSFAPATYEEMLVNRLAEGKGPDIFLLTSEQLGKQRDKILALPPESGQSVAAEALVPLYLRPSEAELKPKHG